jgi:predicted nucleic acid-binding protein
MKKVLLDTNIVLDFALKREAFYENAQAIFCEIVKGSLDGYITASMDAIVTRNITDYKKVQHLDIVQPIDLIQYLRK